MYTKKWLIFWLTAILLLFTANGNLLVTDSVESNYALTAREMAESGDWLSPQIFGSYWYDKPVMFYWLTAAAFKIFGCTEFAARFFPAVFGLAAIGLAVWGGWRIYGRRAGFFSGLILMSSAEFFLISKSIITDSVLFLFFSGTLLFFYLGRRENRKIFWYLMYACAALGTLTKGPIAFLLPGLIITLYIIWNKETALIRKMLPFSGVMLFAALCLPWYFFMYMLHGSAFTDTFFGVHNFLRATVSEHPRDNVWYYYLLVNILALFPWSAVLPLLLWRKAVKCRCRWEDDDKFLLLWAVTVFIFFQCMATKYITYTYPLLFPAALWLGKELAGFRPVFNIWSVKLAAGTGFFLLAAAGSAYMFYSGWENILLPAAALAGCLALYILLKKYAGAIPGAAVSAAVFYMVLTVCIAVPLSQQRSAKDLGVMLQGVDARDRVGFYGKYPVSAVFYSGHSLIKLIHADEVENFRPRAGSWTSKNVMPYQKLEEAGCRYVVVNRKDFADFIVNNHTYRVIRDINRNWIMLAI